MEVSILDTGLFKLDGGAMFGVVPKSIWNKTNPADENNMCTWAMKSLLITEGNRAIVIDSGIGSKQTSKFFSYYYLSGSETLANSLEKKGLSVSSVTDHLLTHLHFDHCGGSIIRVGTEDQFATTFNRAKYWTNKNHWQWATQPNPREKASFLKENIRPMEESGQLNFLKINSTGLQDASEVFPNLKVYVVDGHTEKQMLPVINYKGRTLCFVADLFPSVGHLPIPYVMAYDTRPLLTMEERKAFLEMAVDNNWILVFQHDAVNEAITLKRTEQGIRADLFLRISDL